MNNSKSFFVSRSWKIIMKYAYGVGAAVVIMGALFKIMHWPFASEMLIVGLSVEALIFLLSVTEPVQVDKDWSRVFPELDDSSMDEDSVGLYDILNSKERGTPAINEMESIELEKIRDSISNLSKNIDSLSATIDTISNDLIESSRDSKEYKDSMKSLSLKIKNINSKYESVVDILKS